MSAIFAVVVLLTLSACGSKCITEPDATRLFEEGLVLERDGKPQAARDKYKLIDLFSCSHTALQSDAFYNARRIQKTVERAYAETQAALEVYRAENGRYPESLDQVKNAISPTSLDAFTNFTYFRESDSKIAIGTGLYGSVSFDLSRD